MKIYSFTPNNIKTCSPAFNGRRKLPKDVLPEKLELTPEEVQFNEYMMENQRLERDIYEQRINLYDYYSRSEKDDYREHLKKNNTVKAKMRRFAKKIGVNHYKFESYIDAKKEYNRYAPKLYRSKTKADVDKVLALWGEQLRYRITDVMIKKLAEQIKSVLKK